MGRIEKTVFISYRRTNFYTALAVYQDLTACGYDVFFDYQSIDSGNFEKVIFENIRHKAHFLVVLSPSALERCHEPNDLFRREIEMAIDEKRNIVPLMMENFDFGSPAIQKALTEKLARLSRFNGVGLNAEYFFAGMEKLRNRYLNIKLENIPTVALSPEVEEDTEERQAKFSQVPTVGKKSLTAEEWFERGYVFYESHNFEEALRCNTKVIELNPEHAKAYSNLGLLLHEKFERYDDAEVAYRMAIKINPEYANAYSNLGNLLITLERYDEAEDAYQKAIKINPEDGTAATAYSNLGNLLITLERYDEAEDAYDKAIKINPEYANAYYNLGILLKTMERYDEAENAYQKAIKINPEDGVARASLFGLLKKMGRENEAKEHEALARQLIQKENEYNRACFESLCGNTDEALALLKIAFKKRPSSTALATRDPDLENLWKNPRFKELVGE